MARTGQTTMSQMNASGKTAEGRTAIENQAKSGNGFMGTLDSMVARKWLGQNPAPPSSNIQLNSAVAPPAAMNPVMNPQATPWLNNQNNSYDDAQTQNPWTGAYMKPGLVQR